MVINIIAIISFIAFSAFFSAAETAVFSLNSTRLKRMYARIHSAGRLKRLLKNPDYLLSTIVFGNMLVNIGLASLSTALFVRLFKTEGIIFSIIFSGVIILFLGEVFPKIMAIYLAEKWAIIFAFPLDILSKLFFPVVIFLQKISETLASVFISRRRLSPFTKEELRTALSVGHKAGAISAAEEEMISYVLRFKDTSARQIMTPRVEIGAVDENSSYSRMLCTLKNARHSKLPVFKGSLDNIRGVLYSKEIFLNPGKDWHKFIREPIFVPQSKKIDDILTIFTKHKERVAIVLDEYGGTAGIVTFEDIAEEIFGEIYDEYEVPRELIREIGKNTYRVFAPAAIKNLNSQLRINLPETEDTLAGFVLSYLERIPRPKEEFNYGDIKFIVEQVTRKRLLSVIVKLP